MNNAFSDDTSAAANTWPSYMHGLVSLGERMADQIVDPKDPLLRQEFYRTLYSRVSEGYFILMYQDPKYPEFWPVFNQAFNFGLPNPDDAYYQTLIEGNGVYKLSGFRGTVRILEFQINSDGFFAFGTGALGPTLANMDLDRDAHIGKDGSFEVILSAERPEGYQGDWWKLDAKTTNILARQRSYDWLNEIDGRFTIERLDTPAIKPRASAERIAEQLSKIAAFTENWAKHDIFFGANLRRRGLINKMALMEGTDQGGFLPTVQRYTEGAFDIGPDEALILETEVPNPCRYWNFEMTDELGVALDWMNRQTTLNGHSAKLDSDGKFRAVISSRDPGVPNWLDAADYQRGHIYGRWKECNGNYPIPTLKKVKVAEVRKHLPADTPAVSAEARDASLRLRRKGAQLRRRW